MAYQATQKTEAKKASVRQSILEETLKLVYEGGFSAVSIIDVAANAGIATGTVYRHFSSKSALCTELFRVNTEIEVGKVNDIANSDSSPPEKMQRAIEQFARRAIKGRNLAWALIAEPLDPLLEVERLRYRKAYADIYTQVIKDGIKQGFFSKQAPEISAAALVGALAEALVGPLSPTNKKTLSDTAKKKLVKSMIQFCLNAIGYQGEE